MSPFLVQSLCLAFETTSTMPSVALWASGCFYEARLADNRSQTLCAQLLPTCEALAHEAGVALSQIPHLATTVGPGSFTGIRVGLATAAGLMIPTPRTLFTPTTLDVAAWAMYEQNPRALLTLIDTNRGDFYGQVTDAAFELVTPPTLLSPEAVAEHQGTGLEVVLLNEMPHLARSLITYWHSHQYRARCAPPVPLYVRSTTFVKQTS